MAYNYLEYADAFVHTCNCPDCPQRSVSPSSSDESSDSVLYTPVETPGYSPATLGSVALDVAPALLPSDTQFDQPDGWESIRQQNVIPYRTAVQDADLNCFDYEVPKMLPAPREPPESDWSRLENRQFSNPKPSTSSFNAMLPDPRTELSFNHASYSNAQVEAIRAYYYNMNLSQSQSSFANVQLPAPQTFMPASNVELAHPIGAPLHPDASFGYRAVEEHNQYNSVPPQPNFAMQPMQPSHSAVQQPELRMEQYIPPPPAAQPAPWAAAGPSRVEKRKRTADANDEGQEWTYDRSDLPNEKKIENKKDRLSPCEAGMKIPRSEYVEQPKIARTTKGPSAPKSSKGKGKSAARDAGKPKKTIPRKTKAATSQKTYNAPGEEKPRAPKDDGRPTKKAKTSNSDAPAASSSRLPMPSSSDGGRLVEATNDPAELVKVRSIFQHVEYSTVPSDPFRYIVLAKQKDKEEEIGEPAKGGAAQFKWM